MFSCPGGAAKVPERQGRRGSSWEALEMSSSDFSMAEDENANVIDNIVILKL